MKTINITIEQSGLVKASDKRLGMTGEHNNTILNVSATTGFFDGADYFRMCFGRFETAKLYIGDDDCIEYAVPLEATDSTLKSWQLCCYATDGERATLIRKSDVIHFELIRSVTPVEESQREAAESIESEIAQLTALSQKAQADIEYMDNQLAAANGEFVRREEGKALSSNDFSDAYKAAVDENTRAATQLDKRIGGNYELIETVTVEQPLNAFVRTAEPDGTPYNFERMFVRIEYQKGTAACNLGVMVGDGSKMFCETYMSGALSTTALNRVFTEFYDNRGIWDGRIWMNSGNIYPGVYQYSYKYFPYEYPSITKLWFMQNANVPILSVGTIITIWGVRKNVD